MKSSKNLVACPVRWNNSKIKRGMNSEFVPKVARFTSNADTQFRGHKVKGQGYRPISAGLSRFLYSLLVSIRIA